MRVVVAVIGGFVAWSVLWLVAGVILRAVAADAINEDGTTDSAGVLSALIVASVICSLASGWIAGLVARAGRFAASAVLGVVLLAVGILVQLQMWDALPLWYHLLFLVLLVPATMGGALIAPGGAPRQTDTIDKGE